MKHNCKPLFSMSFLTLHSFFFGICDKYVKTQYLNDILVKYGDCIILKISSCKNKNEGLQKIIKKFVGGFTIKILVEKSI